MRLCVFEDNTVTRLEPLALTRPAFNLRCGALSLLERQVRYFSPGECGVWVREELRALCEHAHPGLTVNDPGFTMNAPVVLANGRWLAPLFRPPASADVSARHSRSGLIGMVGDEVAFVVLPHGAPADWPLWLEKLLDEWLETLPRCDVGGHLIHAPWELVEHNAEAIAEDLTHWHSSKARAKTIDARIHGPRDKCVIASGADVEPDVIIDTRTGPVLIDFEAVVESFTRLQGPCYIGRGSHVLGGRIQGSSIGSNCRVAGEVQESILQGYANKCHDGFLGHSYLGEWVNFGAGTQTSDLRNDYDEIKVRLDGEVVNTGCIKLGSFVGDYTRTGVGTLLNVGTIVGPFCELLPSGTLLPRRIPAFMQYGHGQLKPRTDLRRIIASAETAMKRRGRAWTDAHGDMLYDLYKATDHERRALIEEAEERQFHCAAVAQRTM